MWGVDGVRNNNLLGLLFSNLHDSCVREITNVRAIGSVPFGGRYRLIDFPMSNMVNAGIGKIGIITKNNYQSLMDHIGSGKAWDLSRKTEGLYFLPPYGSGDEGYHGRISSLMGIDVFLRNAKEEYVVMSDCHVVGNIDLSKLIYWHISTGADITVGCKTGAVPGFKDDLILRRDGDGKITDITIGGNEPGETATFGTGLFVLKREFLRQQMAVAVSRNYTHFERDILQRNLDRISMYAYEVPEYTAVISSLAGYYEANMALLRPDIRRQLFLPDRPIYTKVRDCAPAVYGLHAAVKDSLVADGARIDGDVSRSIVFRDVQVGKDSQIKDSIVMQGTTILPSARLGCVICDKNMTVREGSTLQGMPSHPIYVEKNAVI